MSDRYIKLQAHLSSYLKAFTDSIANVLNGLALRRSLANTTRDGGTFHNEDTIFILINIYGVFQ